MSSGATSVDASDSDTNRASVSSSLSGHSRQYEGQRYFSHAHAVVERRLSRFGGLFNMCDRLTTSPDLMTPALSVASLDSPTLEANGLLPIGRTSSATGACNTTLSSGHAQPTNLGSPGLGISVCDTSGCSGAASLPLSASDSLGQAQRDDASSGSTQLVRPPAVEPTVHTTPRLDPEYPSVPPGLGFSPPYRSSSQRLVTPASTAAESTVTSQRSPSALSSSSRDPLFSGDITASFLASSNSPVSASSYRPDFSFLSSATPADTPPSTTPLSPPVTADQHTPRPSSSAFSPPSFHARADLELERTPRPAQVRTRMQPSSSQMFPSTASRSSGMPCVEEETTGSSQSLASQVESTPSLLTLSEFRDDLVSSLVWHTSAPESYTTPISAASLCTPCSPSLNHHIPSLLSLTTSREKPPLGHPDDSFGEIDELNLPFSVASVFGVVIGPRDDESPPYKGGSGVCGLGSEDNDDSDGDDFDYDAELDELQSQLGEDYDADDEDVVLDFLGPNHAPTNVRPHEPAAESPPWNADLSRWSWGPAGISPLRIPTFHIDPPTPDVALDSAGFPSPSPTSRSPPPLSSPSFASSTLMPSAVPYGSRSAPPSPKADSRPRFTGRETVVPQTQDAKQSLPALDSWEEICREVRFVYAELGLLARVGTPL